MTTRFGELHDKWLQSVPLQPCSQCNRPMKIVDLTSHYCAGCNRSLATSVFCRHCRIEMNEDDAGYDAAAEAKASVFVCPDCLGEADTYFYEAVGHVVVDEHAPPASMATS